MTDPQKQADRIRELVAEDDAVRRLGIEVLWAHGTDGAVTLRARRQARTLTAERGPGWLDARPHEVAETFSHDLVADVLGPAPALEASSARGGRDPDRAHRRPGPITT